MHLSFFEDLASATFLTGGAGAGKTELALNLSVWHAARSGGSVVVDLDIVNPFFRVRKLRSELEERQVSVICPEARVVSGDIPALPSAAWGAIEQLQKPVVCDIGGGEPGLRPLGRLKDLAEKRKANVFFVINPFRPGFHSVIEMAKSFSHMSGLSAMKATHIIANPNIAGETSPELFKSGLEKIQEFSAEQGVKIAFAVVSAPLAVSLGLAPESLPGFCEMNDTAVFVLERYWSQPWHFGTV